MTQRFCPHCGYDLQLDSAIMIDEFMMMSSIAQLWWRDRPINTLNGVERSLCYTLMKAYPRPVRVDTIRSRLDSESEGNIVEVYVSRIRKKLSEAGVPNPIITAKGHGMHGRAYMWGSQRDLRSSQP